MTKNHAQYCKVYFVTSPKRFFFSVIVQRQVSPEAQDHRGKIVLITIKAGLLTNPNSIEAGSAAMGDTFGE